MTQDEVATVQAKINELETAASGLRGEVQEAIESARRMNDATRAGQAKLRAIDSQLQTLKAALNEHVAAVTAEAKREANARALAEAEARAKEPQPPSPLEVLTAEVAALRAELAKKG